MSAARLARVAAAWWALAGGAAHAHKPSDSYLRIDAAAMPVTVEWDIALRDLELLVGLDANGDGDITWGEVKERQHAIVSHALARLHLTAGRRECQLALDGLAINRHSDGAYAVLMLTSDCDANEPITVDYRLLFDMDPTHRGLVLFDDGAAVSTHVLSPEQSTVELRVGQSNLWHTLADYAVEGVWHIWIGLDHILFLLTLLLPAVLVRQDEQWQPVDEFRPACWSVLKVVTSFTMAHSITLWLAVMQYVTLPSWLVESAIAASIVVTAANNLYPKLSLSSSAVAFAFGLLHGFGFASVLTELGLSSTSLAVSLLGFNLGVELGQLAIVLAFFPVAFAIRGTDFYRTIVFQWGSVLVAMLAAVWVVERAGNVEILGL
ncbi:MAG: hypothetical protein CMJ58_08750 [Planctomycetaceae bacterium]|nr:hypothetical protein [Planctomycetaceae bacterium]